RVGVDRQRGCRRRSARRPAPFLRPVHGDELARVVRLPARLRDRRPPRGGRPVGWRPFPCRREAGMVRAHIWLRKKDGMTAEEFGERWVNGHAPIARDGFEHLTGYTVDVVTRVP